MCIKAQTYSYHQRQWSSINNETKTRDHNECKDAANDVISPSAKEWKMFSINIELINWKNEKKLIVNEKK